MSSDHFTLVYPGEIVVNADMGIKETTHVHRDHIIIAMKSSDPGT